MRLKETITPPRHVILILLDSGLRIEIPMSELCYQIGLESVDDIPRWAHGCMEKTLCKTTTWNTRIYVVHHRMHINDIMSIKVARLDRCGLVVRYFMANEGKLCFQIVQTKWLPRTCRPTLHHHQKWHWKAQSCNGCNMLYKLLLSSPPSSFHPHQMKLCIMLAWFWIKSRECSSK